MASVDVIAGQKAEATNSLREIAASRHVSDGRSGSSVARPINSNPNGVPAAPVVLPSLRDPSFQEVAQLGSGADAELRERPVEM